MKKILVSFLLLFTFNIQCGKIEAVIEKIEKSHAEAKKRINEAKSIAAAYAKQIKEARDADRFVDRTSQDYSNLIMFPECAGHLAGKLHFCLANKSLLSQEDQEYFNKVCDPAITEFKDCIHEAQKGKAAIKKDELNKYFEEWKELTK